MEIRMYAFRKRINSTKRPTTKNELGQLSFLTECTLKDLTSVLTPQVALLFPEHQLSPAAYNYAYIPDFHRYYWVADIAFDRNRVIYTLSCDVLATYWETLKESTQYVLRSASNKNGKIVDTLYPTLADFKTGSMTIPGWSYNTLSNGYYVLGIINSNTNTYGAISYYVMTNAQFSALRNALMANYDYMQINDAEISAELQRAIINPFQYIVSCKWFPEKPPTIDAVTSITVGSWEFTGGTAFPLAASAYSTHSQNVTLPQHPQKARGEWLKQSPYTRYALSFPPFGIIELDNSKITTNSITIARRIDYVSGIGVLQITTPNSIDSGVTLLYQADCNIGIDIQLSQVSVANGILSDVTNVVGSVASSASAASAFGATGALFAGGASLITSSLQTNTFKGALTGAFANAAGQGSGIGTAIAAANSSLQTRGTNGSIAAYLETPGLFWKFSMIADADSSNLGYPLCARKKLSDLSGFTTVQTPDVDTVSATQPEIAMLVNYMVNGFFIEEGESNE